MLGVGISPVLTWRFVSCSERFTDAVWCFVSCPKRISGAVCEKYRAGCDDAGVPARWARSRTWTSARCTPSTTPLPAPRASSYTMHSRARHARQPPAGSCSPCFSPHSRRALPCTSAPPSGWSLSAQAFDHGPVRAPQVRRTISRFKDRAYSGSFRADGKLLVAGSEDAVVQARALPTPRSPISVPCVAMAQAPGRLPPCRAGGWHWATWSGTSGSRTKRADARPAALQVFDTNSRTLLRQLKGHKRPVRVARYAPDRLHVLSASDDATVRRPTAMGKRSVQAADLTLASSRRAEASSAAPRALTQPRGSR
jgi:hypothetical protein